VRGILKITRAGVILSFYGCFGPAGTTCKYNFLAGDAGNVEWGINSSKHRFLSGNTMLIKNGAFE
jgi:hypothetical protein